MSTLCPRCQASNPPDAERCTQCESKLVLRGRYRLERLLGGGGEGRTYAGRTEPEGEPIAVKELSLTRAADWKAVELFDRAAAVLQSLDHHGVPRYVDHFSEDLGGGLCVLYTVQELVEGESLAQRLARGHRFDEDEVTTLGRSAATILDYLHTRSPPIIHRDIKPSNIMRRPDGSVVLIDFGLVRDDALPEGGSTTGLGSVGYAPLEQFMGQPVPATDVYALGATFIALLSRHQPSELFDAQAGRIAFQEHVSVSRAFRRMLERMTAPSLDQRLRDGNEVLRALDEAERAARRERAGVHDVPEPGPEEADGRDQSLARREQGSRRLARGAPSRMGPVHASTIELRTDLTRPVEPPRSLRNLTYVLVAAGALLPLLLTWIPFSPVVGGIVAYILTRLMGWPVQVGPRQGLHGMLRGRPVTQQGERQVTRGLLQSPYRFRLSPFSVFLHTRPLRPSPNVCFRISMRLQLAPMDDTAGSGILAARAATRLRQWQQHPQRLAAYLAGLLGNEVQDWLLSHTRQLTAAVTQRFRGDLAEEIDSALAGLRHRLHTYVPRLLAEQAGMTLQRIDLGAAVVEPREYDERPLDTQWDARIVVEDVEPW